MKVFHSSPFHAYLLSTCKEFYILKKHFLMCYNRSVRKITKQHPPILASLTFKDFTFNTLKNWWSLLEYSISYCICRTSYELYFFSSIFVLLFFVGFKDFFLWFFFFLWLLLFSSPFFPIQDRVRSIWYICRCMLWMYASNFDASIVAWCIKIKNLLLTCWNLEDEIYNQMALSSTHHRLMSSFI